MTLALVQLGRGFGPVGTVEAPESIATPVISAVAGADSITVTISGEAGATHHVLHKLSSGTTWITGNTRTGDGTVAISGLAAGSYHILAYSVLSDVISEPSQMVTATVIGEVTGEIDKLATKIQTYYAANPITDVTLWFMQAPADEDFPYIVYTWDGSTIDEICGGREDKIETAELSFSVFSRKDDGGLEALEIANRLMQLYDWSSIDSKILAFQRTSITNAGKLDDIWEVVIDYQVMFQGEL